MRRVFVPISQLIILCVLSLSAKAQKPGTRGAGVWDAVQSGKQRAGSASGKTVSSFKRWRAHLEDWGVDTSYRREAGILGRLNSNGWTVGLFYGWKGRESGKKSSAQLTFSEIKHEKEAKQKRENTAFPELRPATPYVYGKVANLYALNLGIGREITLLPKVLEGNVSVGLRWCGGFSLAMLKPYYLRLLYVDYNAIPAAPAEQIERYHEANAEMFLSPSRILGAGRWKNGLNEIGFVPGVFSEAVLEIEPQRSKAFVKKTSLGMKVAFYMQKVSTLVNNTPQRLEIALYAGLQVGKRW